MKNECRMDKCIMPEQQYCPCCPHGYVSYKDEDYDGYEIPTECEWGCTLGCLDERSGGRMTNFERIKNMSAEEMAKTLVEIDEDYMCHVFCKNICKLRDNNCPVAVKNEDCPISTEDCISGWLKSEVLE